MTSRKKTKANRKNSRASTGPRSEEGKAQVAKNARKHGLFARDLVITDGDWREDYEDYARLLEDLKRDLSPSGALEGLLVEKIAVNYWRLRRLIRYESGEIRQLLDDFMQRALEDFYRPNALSAWGLGSSSQPSLEYHDYGDAIPESDIAAQLRRVQSLREHDQFYAQDPAILQILFTEKVAPDCATPFPGNWREQVAAFLERLDSEQKATLREELLAREVQVLAEMQEVARWNRKFDMLARVRAVPEDESLNKIMRYETSLERSIFRNLNQLRQLQATRKTESSHQGK